MNYFKIFRWTSRRCFWWRNISFRRQQNELIFTLLAPLARWQGEIEMRNFFHKLLKVHRSWQKLSKVFKSWQKLKTISQGWLWARDRMVASEERRGVAEGGAPWEGCRWWSCSGWRWTCWPGWRPCWLWWRWGWWRYGKLLCVKVAGWMIMVAGQLQHPWWRQWRKWLGQRWDDRTQVGRQQPSRHQGSHRPTQSLSMRGSRTTHLQVKTLQQKWCSDYSFLPLVCQKKQHNIWSLFSPSLHSHGSSWSRSQRGTTFNQVPLLANCQIARLQNCQIAELPNCHSL